MQRVRALIIALLGIGLDLLDLLLWVTFQRCRNCGRPLTSGNLISFPSSMQSLIQSRTSLYTPRCFPSTTRNSGLASSFFFQTGLKVARAAREKASTKGVSGAERSARCQTGISLSSPTRCLSRILSW